MPVKKYDRKTNTFYILKPKLLHIGNIKRKKKNNNTQLSQKDKYRIFDFVNKVEYFGTEFGAKSILSLSDYDIFKIRDKINDDKSEINKMNIEKEKYKKHNPIDIIKKQLGL